eukprot:PITA_14055
MANERMDKLEENVNEIQTQLRRLDLDRMNRELSGLTIQLQKLQEKGKENLMSNSKEKAHEEGYNGHEGIYDESSHSPHVWHTHPPPNDATKLMLGSMYFENEWWQWWKWHQRCNGYFRTWTQFTKALRDRFEQEDSYLGRLTKLRQIGTVEEYISAFEGLAFRTKGLTDEFYTECFISGLKEAIKAQVLLHDPPTWTEACQVAHKVECALAA